ncbi:MAG: pyridoxamine 5'-phosphate oxidase family protein [Candidatus Pacebacteria bacterium]|nr:pyridoxamine 5'-phosphate oxidase family protein [Candidatus Paceibacterota bacterium]
MVKIRPKTKKIIEGNPVAFATVGNNKPYVIGTAYCRVVEKNKILITDNFMNSTIKNILENNNVALVAWDNKWNGVQIIGKAKYYKKGKWLDFVKNIEENNGMPSKGAILIKINKIIESK